MTDLPLDMPPVRPRRGAVSARLNRLIATPAFQSWAARFPFVSRLVRRDGEALFDLVAGFCQSQALAALVALDVPRMLLDGPLEVGVLARRAAVPEARMRVLLRAGVALGLLGMRRGDRFALSRKGAALSGVPGLRQMILHHAVLYRDLADPVAFFRGETAPDLARFWPYVFGAGADPEQARLYSELMAQSQATVAEDTLATVSLAGVRKLLDVGGGTGAFLAEACRRTPGLSGILFDLPPVVAAARSRLAEVAPDLAIVCREGSFRTDPLPRDADAISLVRVLYDHADETVEGLLARCFEALPSGGRLVVSEPMTGGARPERAGDVYFALYTMAMQTGRARSSDEIAGMIARAGFSNIRCPRPRRPFITSVVTAVRP